jgi:aryl-alcohol dehydrogenase-like predicted oxidoreductase
MENKQENNMVYRYLGSTGLKVSVMSFGHMIGIDSQEQYDFYKSAIKRCYESGVNYFDTAEVYGFGISETLLGRALKELNYPRESYVISTKILRCGTDPNVLLSRKHIIEGTNNCLKRLQLDYVDIIFCHRPDYETPLEETCRAMSWLID